MTTLNERMREELVRRNYSKTTIHSYLKAVEHFSAHIDIPNQEIGGLRSQRSHMAAASIRLLRSSYCSTLAGSVHGAGSFDERLFRDNLLSGLPGDF